MTIASAPDAVAVGTDLLVCMARVTRWAGWESALTIPSAQLRVLSQLDELGPSRISRLAAVDRCAQPTMTVLVQRLEEHGWVTRGPDRADTRASLISLNAAGSRALREAREAAGAAIAADLTSRGDDEVLRAAEAVQLLRRLLAHDETTTTTGTHV